MAVENDAGDQYENRNVIRTEYTMKWMEIIAVRSIASNMNVLKVLLQELMKDVNKTNKSQIIKIYDHVTVDSDFNIHLYHDSEKPEPNGSSPGRYLTSSLKKYGLVDRNVWVQES